MGKHARAILLILGIFVFVIFVVERVLTPTQTTRISYSQFYASIQQDKISKVTLSGHDVSGEYRDTGGKFQVTTPNEADYLPELRKHHVEINVDQQNTTPIIGYILQLVPFVLMGLLLIFILRQAQSGGSQALSFGRSRAKLLSENRPKVTFNDVAGIEEAKRILTKIPDVITDLSLYQMA